MRLKYTSPCHLCDLVRIDFDFIFIFFFLHTVSNAELWVLTYTTSDSIQLRWMNPYYIYIGKKETIRTMWMLSFSFKLFTFFPTGIKLYSRIRWKNENCRNDRQRASERAVKNKTWFVRFLSMQKLKIYFLAPSPVTFDCSMEFIIPAEIKFHGNWAKPQKQRTTTKFDRRRNGSLSHQQWLM